MARTNWSTLLVRGSKSRALRWLVGGLAVVAISVAVRSSLGPRAVRAGGPLKGALTGKSTEKAPVKTAEQAAEPSRPTIVAVVNNDKILRTELAQDALLHHGEDVLQTLLNKMLIEEGCRRRNLAVTQEELSQEIDRTAERFGVATEQWLKMLKEERNISPQQYALDIIWPTLALRKLAAERVQPTEAEIQQAYETQFGPAVQARLIVSKSKEEAHQLLARARQNPAEFGNLAKEHSIDVSSASAKGLLQPIRKHLGDPNLERVAFGLREGEISEVLAVNGAFAILKCEKQLPPRGVPLENVRQALADSVRDKKLRQTGEEVFKQLQSEAQIEVYFGKQPPGTSWPAVAATINGKPITLEELGEVCIARHGLETLEGAINRKLLEQASRRNNLVVTAQDLDAEIARAAEQMGSFDKNGQVDVAGWLKRVLEEQKTTEELYRRDAVWPSVLLRKLVEAKVEVTSEDMKRGFEANYGPRKECLAIVFNSNQLRKAQEVWDMARRKPTKDYFGDLAEEYSVEASSRVLRGEIPPIQKYSGQPQLEKEAFQLQAGQLSSVFQLGDKWVILYCTGDTKPTAVNFEEVRQMIYDDVREKKVRVAMGQVFGELQEAAYIDNFIAGTSRSPAKGKSIDGINPAGAAPGIGGAPLAPIAPTGPGQATAPATPRR